MLGRGLVEAEWRELLACARTALKRRPAPIGAEAVAPASPLR